ncbi:MAG TPA: ATP-binding protein [Candidatus Obscuribacterales bacterium]
MAQNTTQLQMYKNLRLRLTAWYLLLTGITSIFLIAVGTWLCHKSITDSLDKSLEELIASNLPQVEVIDDLPRFVFANEKVANDWAHQQSTLQLFTRDGKLIEEFGPPGKQQIALNKDYFEADVDGRHIRATSDPILSRGKIVGYLQAQIPTELRETATREFTIVMAALIPLLLIIIGASGYFFSMKASRPVENAFRLLRQFMADASHELRTPVHSIQLMAENVAAEADGNAQLIKDMEGITKSTDRMAKLIDDMMMLTKMELQQLPMQIAAVRIDQLVFDAVEEMKPAFGEKSIAVHIEELQPAIVEGDKHSLHRVVSNLLQNALRYTDAGGTVNIKMETNGGTTSITVSDTGIGISAENLAHVFERFYRVDKSRARAAGGSGLGLSIVKAICEHHKGTICVDSTEGKGSTFVVTLPVSSVAAHS